MYYYKKDSNIHIAKLNTIKQELNTLLSIAIQNPCTRIAIITTEDKIPYYAKYIYNFLELNEICLCDEGNILLQNNSYFHIRATEKINYEKDYILTTKTIDINKYYNILRQRD